MKNKASIKQGIKEINSGKKTEKLTVPNQLFDKPPVVKEQPEKKDKNENRQ
jgi:hypothetical protein